MSSEMCKRCIHHTGCMRDKNIIGDVFVAGHPDYFDNKKLFERFIEREKAGFPCDTFCGWIPCSERLPKYSGTYLATLVDEDGQTWGDTREWESTFGGKWLAVFDSEYRDVSNVVAWMPLPEPYEAEQ